MGIYTTARGRRERERERERESLRVPEGEKEDGLSVLKNVDTAHWRAVKEATMRGMGAATAKYRQTGWSSSDITR